MGLPDFLLPVNLLGEPRSLLARDVTVAEFFHGFPNSVPMTACFRKETAEGQHGVTTALETWADALLTRAVVEPRLTLELVHRLGESRDRAVITYLRTVGWTEQGDAGEAAGPLLKAERIEIDPLVMAVETFRPFTTVPVDNIKQIVKVIASRCRVAPHVLWMGWKISEFIWDWRILMQDDLLRRGAESSEADEMLAAAGIEEG